MPERSRRASFQAGGSPTQHAAVCEKCGGSDCLLVGRRALGRALRLCGAPGLCCEKEYA